ncbi:MAG: putative glycoside hydrolase [Chloroflexia bacterium]
MPKRRPYSSYSSSYGYGREKQRRVPSPVPYLVVILLAGAGLAYFHFIAFQSLSGRVLNAYSGTPMPGVVVTVRSGPPTPGAKPAGPAAAPLTTTTGAEGSFSIDKLPPDPVLAVAVDGFTPEQIPVAGRRSFDVKLVPNMLKGRVLSKDGKPVAGATVWAGAARTQTGPGGDYVLKDIPAERKLVVKAPGYLSNAVEFGRVVTQDVTLEPMVAKAINVNADSIATPGKLQALLDLVDRTELTAVVVDVKGDNSGNLLYDSQLPLAQQLGVIHPIIPDLNGLLATLKEKKIYAIARLSVFWDPALASAKPEWGLKSKKAPGQLWTDPYGKRWANPYAVDVWNYNIDIAKEVASRGFNEVQFENVQFPSDGQLDDIDFGPVQGGRKRVDAVSGFLSAAYKALSPMGVYVACNVFGLSPYVQDDMGVGQHFEEIAANTDYIDPYIYPANFGDGFMGFPKPAEHPGDVVAQTVKAAAARLGTSPAKIRPWLQDFSSGKVKYEAPQVRAELDAAEQSGAVGWMLWNFGNAYTEGALKKP